MVTTALAYCVYGKENKCLHPLMQYGRIVYILPGIPLDRSGWWLQSRFGKGFKFVGFNNKILIFMIKMFILFALFEKHPRVPCRLVCARCPSDAGDQNQL